MERGRMLYYCLLTGMLASFKFEFSSPFKLSFDWSYIQVDDIVI